MAEVNLDVYYDGDCPICIAGRQCMTALDTESCIKFIDLNQFSPQSTPMHETTVNDLSVRLPDGSWCIGYDAWAAIIERMSFPIGTLSKLMAWSPIAMIGRRFYCWFAPRRYQISQIVGMRKSKSTTETNEYSHAQTGGVRK